METEISQKPLLNSVFKTKPLSFDELAVTILLSSVVFFAVEMEKMFKRLKGNGFKLWKKDPGSVDLITTKSV